MEIQQKIKPYKLEIKALIFYVSAICIFLFSGVLLFFRVAEKGKLTDLLWDYGTIIAPVTILWALLEKRLWRTKVMQNIKTYLNIPPDLRGRWEGYLVSSVSPDDKKDFAIEVEQTLTTLNIFSYSAFGNSSSILAEIGSDEREEIFSMCYLWQSEIRNETSQGLMVQRFNGYTMLHWNKPNKVMELHGTYFTDLLPNQTHGRIYLKWVSHERKKAL